MRVIATRRGFDGMHLRQEGDEFDFVGFKIFMDGEEIKDNLGSWMKLTADGEKDYSKAAASLKRNKTKAKKKADSKD